VNSDFSDIASAITDSLSRTGQGGMTAQLGLALSGFNYTSDPDTGMSRTGANQQAVTVGGSNWTFTTTDLTAPDGTSLLTAFAPIPGEVRAFMGATAPAGWLFMRGQACTTSYPRQRALLVADGNKFGTSGGDPLFPNMQCVLPVGLDATSRGLLTGSTVLGALLGAQSQTIAQANLPNVSLTTSIASGQGSHPHSVINASTGEKVGYITADGGGSGPPVGLGLNTGNDLPLTAANATLPAMTGTTPLGGSGTALSVVQPSLVLNFIGPAI
jgi:microcystin-dependent protein